MVRTSLFLTLFLFSCFTALAQTARQAINQYTFARLYGYVRFFHPSDAGVVTDWDALAIYGAQAVDGAKNATELKTALEGIFHPIAPTLRIYETGKPALGPLEAPRDADRMKVVMWQHSGYGPGGGIYKSIRTNSYNFQPKAAGPAGGAMKAEFTGTLFPIDLAAGTFLHKDLGNGITIDMPMALWGDGKTTFPATDTIAARALSQQRAAGLPAPLTGENLYLRLANVCITWNIYQHFHPYFKEWTTNWDQDLQTAIADCYRDKTPADFERTLARLNARLHDGHTFVSGPQTFADRRFLPLQLAWADNSLVVTAVFTPDTKARRGDVITAINGMATQQYLKQRAALVSAGSANAMMRQTISSLCVSKPDSSLQLTFRSGRGQTWREKVPFSIPANEYYGKLPNTRPAAFDSLGNGIIYLDLSRLGWNEMKGKMDEIAAAKGVVVDLRGYPKDENGSQLIGHLITKKNKDKWMHTQRIARPDHENTGWDSFGWNLSPKKPHIAGKTVFLTDGSAISYAESVMGYIKDQHLATIIGEPTAGANGNVTDVSLPGGYRFRYTGMKVTQHNGAQHFTKGITPDILIAPTIKGIIDNKDELLEKAVDVIKNGQSTVKSGREAK
ncbi:S41 family peptidase [Chitinophaga rhizosphaerae]|uniref:S41 family peptidase n=1 Tax=Chitinophaga rhizosphaerae TaxID=1864947 RepID=UPI000F815AED|nr:S41 family peptidase [Chitinophaga rhizosphaerae]